MDERRWCPRRAVRAFVIGLLTTAALGGAWPYAEAQAEPICAAPAPGESMFVTEDCADPRFNDGYAFVAVDELRQAPVPHRFVYGGFRGTDARFAFYFPATEQYEGRFFQGPTHQLRLTGELVFPNEALFAFDSGAYLIQTNNGGSENCLSARENYEGRCDPSVSGYRVAAAAAKFSRQVAARVYGTTDRPYGYIYGGSGGAYQTISAAERTQGVWDGSVPFVMGDPHALLHHFTIRAHAVRVLGEKFDDVIDAMAPGGSGDPYATLDAAQAAALREVTRFGFPMDAWQPYASYAGPNYLTGEYIKLHDPTYAEDFWSKSGYLGTESSPEGEALRAARVRHDATVVAAVPHAPEPAPQVPATPYDALGPAYPYFMLGTIMNGYPPKAFVVDSLPSGDLRGAWIEVLTGPASGRSCPLSVSDLEARVIQCAGGSDPDVIKSIGPGDRIRIDNSWALAYETYARHDLPPTEWQVQGYDQYRAKNRKPRYPQRARSAGLDAAPRASGSIATGDFHGKMIVLNTLQDQDAFAYPAEWYRQQAARHRRDGDLRVWFIDNANHGVGYLGALEQALRDVATWAETGVAPVGMSYTLDADTQIRLPAAAVKRGGVQPVIDLTVGGADRVEVRAGEPVTLVGTITVPPGTGSVVCAEWDPEGQGTFVAASDVLPPVTLYDPGAAYANVSVGPNPACEAGTERETFELTHTYSEPGTYFPTLRGTAQRDGDPRTNYGRVQNLATVRVVVS